MNLIEQEIFKKFRFVDAPLKKKTLHRIKIGGKFITLGNKNKTIWPSLGAAKTSLRLHMHDIIVAIILRSQNIPPDYVWNNRESWKWEHTDPAWTLFLDESIKSGFLEFVPV